MAFDKQALNHFFRAKEELGIADNMQAQLKEEGIEMAEDLQHIDINSMKELANNLCCPSGASRRPRAFSVMSQTKMIDAANCMCHCLAMGGETSPDHCCCAII